MIACSSDGSPAAGGATMFDGSSAAGCAPVPFAQNPRSIAEVVRLVNALEKPLALPCFLAHLAGPLEMTAALSPTSAQTSFDRRSPRIFVFLDPLVLTVVPEGPGRDLLEFGERRGDARSLKGEIAFPLASELAPEAPFEHILFNEQYSTCAFCHADETRAPDVPFARAFESVALRPPDRAVVGVDELRSEVPSCDAASDPYRCAMLHALFDRDGVIQRDFPESYGTL
ncbi:hypothetical protein BE04_02685 [Sorangium cellulosum]|uniref:Uncharacterized protein n=1 Tax=Sorangium cellulosum TaxID=56 RepID=A0A150QER4_SORCE|nr:hypothetical protein BE04_02685 [Sorangium cellulosum]